MMSLKAVAGLAVLSQALALPMFYDERKMGCEIPTMAFGSHMAPTPDPLITFELADASGPVTMWEAGAEYTLTVTSYEAPANAWIHATVGTLAPADTATHSAAACGEAVYSTAAQASHVLSWTAPATAGCVTVSSAQATGASAGYATGTVEVCAAGGAAVPAVAPVAADGPEEGGVEGAVDDVEDVADDAAGEVEGAADDAAETVEADGAVSRSAAAAVVAAAAAVLAAVM